MEWQSIETAPRDGSVLWLKRIFEGHIIAEGKGYFGDVTVHYQASDGGPQMFKAVWANVDGRHFFPTPTHWMPTEAL